MNKKIFFIVILLLAGISGFTQFRKIEFQYDMSGNRTSRSLINGLVKKDLNGAFVPASYDSLVVLNENIRNSVAKADEVSEFQFSEAKLSIYPNPTMGRLTIGLKNFKTIDKVRVEITDSYGKQIFISDKSEPVYSVDLSDYASGYYYINLMINGVVGNYSVIKQ